MEIYEENNYDDMANMVNPTIGWRLNTELFGMILIKIVLQVMTPPVITQLNGNPDSVVAVGESLMIQCSTQGLPEPEVELKKIPEPVRTI